MAIKVERQLKQKGISKYNIGSGLSYKLSWNKKEKGIPKRSSQEQNCRRFKGER